MSSLHLFLLAFLIICFTLVIIQQDLKLWQKLSLLANPALLALIITVLSAKTSDDNLCAADLVPVVNTVSKLLSDKTEPQNAKAVAARLRKFVGDHETDWKKLNEDLKSLTLTEETAKK